MERQLSLAHAYRQLAEVARRELASGGPIQIAYRAQIARDTDAARFATTLALRSLWRTYTSETAEPGIKQSIAAIVPFRRLRAWMPDAPGTLVTGRGYPLQFHFAPLAESGPDPSLQPDFGPAGFISLSLHLFSSDFTVEQHVHRLKLWQKGDSEGGQTTITPLRAGSCELRFVVTLEPQMELLQDYRAVMQVESY